MNPTPESVSNLAETVALNLLVLSVAATGGNYTAMQRVASLSAAMNRGGFWALVSPGLATEVLPMIEAVMLRSGVQPPDAIDRVKRVRAMGPVNPENGAHRRGLSETLEALRENGWDVEAADQAMRGAS